MKLLRRLIDIGISPWRDILGVAVRRIGRSFDELGLTVLFLVERIAFELELAEDEGFISQSIFARHDEIAVASRHGRPYQFRVRQSGLHQRHASRHRITYFSYRSGRVDKERIVVHAGAVVRLRDEGDMVIQRRCRIDIEVRASAFERALR